MIIEYKKDGSGWHRWDLHLHGPGTKLANAYGDSTEENLRTYIEVLEASDVQVFGITDYFSFGSYLAVSAEYARLYGFARPLAYGTAEKPMGCFTLGKGTADKSGIRD